MKIIDNKKDYYDYLMGVYGVDEKIILDRRTHHQPIFTTCDNHRVFSIVICGKAFDFVYMDGDFIYLDDIKEKYAPKEKPQGWRERYRYMYYHRDKNKVYIKESDSYADIVVVDDDQNLNKKEKCPILLCRKWSYRSHSSREAICHYPILSDLKFAKILPAEDIFKMLSAYLAPKDLVADNMTNKEKIVAHGFDLKDSFRNTK